MSKFPELPKEVSDGLLAEGFSQPAVTATARDMANRHPMTVEEFREAGDAIAAKRSSGRPGIGKDGAAGVAVQVILPSEVAAALDAWAKRNGIGRGPAARKILLAFFGEGWSESI